MADERISVSRETLRAELLQVRLDIGRDIADAVKQKVDRSELDVVRLKVDSLDRGDFTDVHRRALSEFVDQRMAARSGGDWSRRERITLAACAVGTFGYYVLIAIHGGVIG